MIIDIYARFWFFQNRKKGDCSMPITTIYLMVSLHADLYDWRDFDVVPSLQQTEMAFHTPYIDIFYRGLY